MCSHPLIRAIRELVGADMTDHVERLSRPVRPAPTDFAANAIKHHIIADAPPDYEEAMAAIRPAALWVRVLAIVVLAALSWALVILLALLALVH